MAHYRHLPVWKAAMELAVHLEHSVRRFPRYHQYTLGTELRQTAQRLCRWVARANNAGADARYAALNPLRAQLSSFPGQLCHASSHQVVSQSGHFKTGFKQRTLTAVCLPAAMAPSGATPLSRQPLIHF